MQKILTWFERIIIGGLIFLMAVTVFFSALDLARRLYQELASPPFFLMDVDELLDTFGLFLLVIIGLELLGTLEAYLEEHMIHVEVVFMVAMIAIARKVIILDVKELPSATLLGMAAIIIALSAGYYLFKCAWSRDGETEKRQPSALQGDDKTDLPSDSGKDDS
jgi:uncharacterized membrane protein (DUF373 family)